MRPLLGVPIRRRCAGRRTRGATCALLLAIGAAVGCGDARPVRLTSHTGDTLVVNHHRPTRLAVLAVDARGRLQPAGDVQWQQVGGDTLTLAPDGTVHCTRAADGLVEVTHGAVRSPLFVRCRPVTASRSGGTRALRVGDAPVEFVLHPLGPDREPVQLLAGTAAVRDTSVVVLRDAALHVRGRGRTHVDVQVGNCAWQEPVEVLEAVRSPEALEPYQLFEERVSLVPGEMRMWTLRANLYWFELEADSATHATLQFGTTGFNCAVGRAAERALSCITRDSGRVVVRHLGLRTTSADATVRMRVSMLTHPDSSPTQWRLATAALQRARRTGTMCPVVF
jgi:hypothetical protein